MIQLATKHDDFVTTFRLDRDMKDLGGEAGRTENGV